MKTEEQQTKDYASASGKIYSPQKEEEGGKGLVRNLAKSESCQE